MIGSIILLYYARVCNAMMTLYDFDKLAPLKGGPIYFIHFSSFYFSHLKYFDHEKPIFAVCEKEEN